jgi:hypothetical protein
VLTLDSLGVGLFYCCNRRYRRSNQPEKSAFRESMLQHARRVALVALLQSRALLRFHDDAAICRIQICCMRDRDTATGIARVD